MARTGSELGSVPASLLLLQLKPEQSGTRIRFRLGGTEHVDSHVYWDILTVIYGRSRPLTVTQVSMCHIHLGVPMTRLLSVTHINTCPRQGCQQSL